MLHYSLSLITFFFVPLRSLFTFVVIFHGVCYCEYRASIRVHTKKLVDLQLTGFTRRHLPPARFFFLTRS
eukprot:SAG31_NODE_5143_length_2718_cov_1.647957_2_plen_70_part_00